MEQVVIQGSGSELSVVLSGEIDSGNAEEFYGEVMSAYNAAPRDVVFFCKELSFIDSTTLGTFVKIFKHVRTDGHGMKLKELQPRIKKLFVICALDTIMEIE